MSGQKPQTEKKALKRMNGLENEMGLVKEERQINCITGPKELL